MYSRQCTLEKQSQHKGMLASFHRTSGQDFRKGGEVNGDMHCPLKHHSFPTAFLPTEHKWQWNSCLLPKSTLSSKINRAVLWQRELFLKLTLQHNASPPSQLGSAPTLTLKFLSNHCKSNPESLKTGKNCYFLLILAQCTEMEQGMTGLKM